MVPSKSRIQFVTTLTRPILLLDLVTFDVISERAQVDSDVSFTFFFVISAVVNTLAEV